MAPCQLEISVEFFCIWLYGNSCDNQGRACQMLIVSAVFESSALRWLDTTGTLTGLTWTARYYTGLLIKLTPKGVVFSFLFSFSDWTLDSTACLMSSPGSSFVVDESWMSLWLRLQLLSPIPVLGLQGQLSLQLTQHLQMDHLRSHGLAMQLSLSNAANADEPAVRLQMMHVNASQDQVPAKMSIVGDDWVVESFKGRYPEGSKALHGQDRSYIISPLGNLVDEKYTAYFDFQMPL